MGRRSRKRRVSPPGRTPASEPGPQGRRSPPPRPPAPPTRRARLQDAPPAPWSPFPLVELTILIGIVLTILGAIGVADRRGLFIACGIALIYIATLELSLREHFAGYRSHSSLLAGVAAIATSAVLFFTGVPYEVIGLAALIVFGACFWALRAAFQRRTGGIGFRV